SLTAPLHFECHLRVNAVGRNFSPIHAGAEFLHVNGANVAQCLGSFRDHILRRVLPAFRRFRKHLDYFDDLWHQFGFLSLPFRAASAIWSQRPSRRGLWLRRASPYQESRERRNWQSLGADEAASSNSFESKPGGTRFVVSQTSG